MDSDAHRRVDPGQATPDAAATAAASDAHGDGRPLTRRELRARERAEEAAAQTVTASAAQRVADASATDTAAADAPASHHASTHRMPPLVCQVAASVSPSRPHRRRAWIGKGVSLIAMVFVVGMAVATSIPADALVSHDAILAAAHSADETPAAPVEAQSITSGGDVMAQQVTRDHYEVKSFEQLVVLSHIRIANTFTNDPNGTIQWPFPVGVPIADYYGPRVAPTEGASTFHQGVDFDPGYGTPIQIIADGVVREVHPYDDSALGVHVIIDHMIDGQLVSSVYGHMIPGSIRVSQGQKVKVADIVGEVGTTGISTGPHLHFEIRLNGTTPVDPYAWLKANAN